MDLDQREFNLIIKQNLDFEKHDFAFNKQGLLVRIIKKISPTELKVTQSTGLMSFKETIEHPSNLISLKDISKSIYDTFQPKTES